MILAIFTIVLFLIALLLCNCFFYKEKPVLHAGGGNLSLDDTKILKGIAIIMVIVGHIGSAIPGLRLFTPLGATGVGLFLVCSGYGIEKSYNKNGRIGYWRKRIINVWIPYAIIELFALPLHIEKGCVSIIKDLLLIETLHPFGWYMQYIFVWYIVYYLFSFIKKRSIQYALYILLITIIICFSTALYAQNSFSFLIGILIARIECSKYISCKNLIVLGVITSCLFVCRDYAKNNAHNVLLLWNPISLLYYTSLIVLSILVYELVIKAKNKMNCEKGFLCFGVFSYELYLAHGYACSLMGESASILTILEFVVLTIIGSISLKKINTYTINKLVKNNQ